MLKFQGGKAVASFVGAFAYLAPLPLLAITIVFVAVVASTRYVSLGAIIGAALFPLGRILDGGTWAGGRRIAAERRPGGEPPVQIYSDGTVF